MPAIRTSRQRRAIAAFARKNRQTVKDLRDLVGMNNIPELMAQLHRNGWKWSCERVETLDRDGNICRPGFYSLSEDHRKLAAELLEVNYG